MATTKMQHITINNEISITTVCLDDHEAPIATPKETRKDGTLLDESPTHSVQEEAPPPATSRRMKQWLNSKASGAKSSISEDNSDTSSRSRSRSRAGSKNSGEEQRVVATTSAGGFSFGSFKANYNSMNNNNNNNNSQPCVPPRRRISVPLIEQDIKDLSLQETDNQGSPTTSERSSPWSWAPSSTLSLSSTFGSLQQSRK